MISYEEQQKLNAMPRTMTISEIREELDRLNIKYTFYDCHAGSNNSSFTIFNAQVICPVGYSLDNGIYATDKNNWFVLNKERISKEKINIQDREVCICCDNLLRLIDKGFIRDEESLLAQSKILNNDLQKQGEESQVRIRKNRK